MKSLIEAVAWIRRQLAECFAPAAQPAPVLAPARRPARPRRR